jgi:lambda repressor-like predicted transcriptional regulator
MTPTGILGSTPGGVLNLKPMKGERMSKMKALMHERGLTLVKLAELTGIPRSTLGRISNRGNPRTDVATKIAAAFGVEVKELWP